MKRLLPVLLLLLLCLCPAQARKTKTHVRWATFNIRYDNQDDARHGWGWDVRRRRVAEYVLDNGLDIVGMQEVLHRQALDLQQLLPGYAMVGVGREDGKQRGEYAALWYRTERFEALDSGNFWLSETPDVVGSRGWDAALERIATWAKLREKKTGRIFMAVNTHFDHVGVEARRQSALLIIRRIREIVGHRPAVVTGDFNVDEHDPAYRTMVSNDFVLRDVMHVGAPHTGVGYSYHDFSRTQPDRCHKIDFIFVTPQIQVTGTHIGRDHAEYILSDHNPHYADLVF